MADVSRRALFGRIFGRATEQARTLPGRFETPDRPADLPPERRPPGAVKEILFLQRCTRCGDCVTACPERAIHTSSAGTGVRAGTPVMQPQLVACIMCEGFPCAAACPEGALEMPEAPTWLLGQVAVRSERCITWMGPECGACVDVCPGDLRAIALKRWRPFVNADECVGCGLCIAACPTSPKALELLPLPSS